MSIDIDNLPCESMTFIIFILMLSHIYYFYGPALLNASKAQYWTSWKWNNFPLSKSKLSRIVKNNTHSKFTRRVSPSKCIHTHQHTVWKCAFKSGTKTGVLREVFSYKYTRQCLLHLFVFHSSEGKIFKLVGVYFFFCMEAHNPLEKTWLAVNFSNLLAFQICLHFVHFVFQILNSRMKVHPKLITKSMDPLT